jgi:WD40 repeat protein
MNRPCPVTEKVNSLRADVPQLDDYRRQLLQLVEAAQVKLDLALLVARGTVERVVNAVLAAEQVEVRRDLLDNIETLGSREERPAKRRGGRSPCLPENIYSSLHNLRIYGNLVAHPFEPGTTQPKDVSLRASDLDVALGQLLRVVEWYFEEYAHGPRLPTIYASPPSPEQSALETAVRLEQQYHLRGFVGRQVELQGVQDWIDSGLPAVTSSRSGEPSRTDAPGTAPAVAELAKSSGAPAPLEKRDSRATCLATSATPDGAARLAAPTGGSYLLLLGPPGQGKSALLAELARREQEPARGGCLLHMIKSESAPLRFVPGLLQQAARLAGTSFDPESQRGELPQLRNALSAALQTLRERTGRAVLLIDAFDELVADDPQRAYDPRIEFLPPILPPGVRVVLTCRPNIPLVQALEGWLVNLTRREVPPLSAGDFRRLLESRLDEPTLRAVESMLGVDELFARLGGNPLLLSKASERIEELARQASAEGRPLQLTLAEVPATLQAVFRDEYNRIGERAGTRWTSAEGRHKARLLQLLCVAREGLDHRELAGLLTVAGIALPAEDCRDRLAEMSPYLAELGGGRFKPWHQGLTDHVRQEVLGAEGLRQAEEVFCSWMATEHGGRYALRHRVQHLLAVGRAGEVAQLLATLPELEARAEAGLVFELAGDFSAVAARLPEGKERRRLELLGEAIRRDIHFIERHREDYPQALFQCLWNSCWWYDCPEAAGHYTKRRAPGEKMASTWLNWLVPWRRWKEELALHQLLESWRAAKELEPGFVWLRSLRPPTLHLGTAQKVVFRGHKNLVSSVRFSPDGCRLVSGSWDGTVRVWDVQTGAELLCLRGHEHAVTCVSFSADGHRLVSGSGDNTLRLWEARTGAELLCLRGHEGAVWSVSFSADGCRLVSGSGDETVRVWEAQSGAELLCLRGHEGGVTSVSFSADGRHLVSGSGDKTVRVWEAQTGAELLCLRGHEADVSSVSFSADGRRLVSGSWDGTVRVWEAQTGTEMICLRGHRAPVLSVSFSPDGRRLVSGSWDETVRVWEAQSGAELLCLRGHQHWVWSVSFSADGRRIVSGSQDITVRVWEAQGEAELLCLCGHERTVTGINFSPDGRRIVSGSEDNTVRVWEAQTGTQLLCLRGHGFPLTSVGFSPDGRRIVSGSWDHTVRLWDAQSGAELVCLRGHEGGVTSVNFSADGRRLVGGSMMDQTVRVWEAQSGAELVCLRGHEGGVTSVSFSADGRRIVSGSEDNTVRVWEAQTGTEMICLRGHRAPVLSVSFSPDGRRLVSRSKDQTVRVWEAQTGTCLEVLQGTADPTAVAAESPVYPWRALGQTLETVIETAASGQPLAWFSEFLEQFVTHPVTHPSGRTWAGSIGNYLCLFTLEGNPQPPANASVT